MNQPAALALAAISAVAGFAGGLMLLLRRGDVVWAEEARQQVLDIVRVWESKDDPSHASFRVREGSSDIAIVFEVLARNEYRLPEQFAENDIVIDIGGHIGSFSFAALARGASVQYFEPAAENVELAMHNLQRFGQRVSLHQKAVWRSDQEPQPLALLPHSNLENLGGGNVISLPDGGGIETVRLDDVISELTSSGNRIRLIKLDCEGSEYPILLTSSLLHLVDELCGEHHTLPPSAFAACPDLADQCTPEDLRRHLEAQGFTVEMETPNEFGLGHFFARRSDVRETAG